eukprot:TRINITY_DN21730_c0_g1_i1.p1 TRINITY_DN21730_c0_g1~~TRINITY_DN21730_c0_g1_i1.p1  ORF type:complete len:226 (-),score=58.86 TRINITY_DN21730_c0_g1_i1:413-1090(-)
MIRRPPRSTLSSSSAASDVYKRQSGEPMSRILWQCGLVLMAIAVNGYDLTETEKAHVQTAFDQHQSGGGTVPLGSLGPMVGSLVSLNTAKKFSADVTKKHIQFLLNGYNAEIKKDFSLQEFMAATDKLQIRDANNPPTPAPKPECLDEDGKPLPKHIQKRLGSCQLKQLRAKLERNRLTMPLFDTLRWVRDFERSLEAMWEIYASGHDPMNVVVFPTDPREYRSE